MRRSFTRRAPFQSARGGGRPQTRPAQGAFRSRGQRMGQRPRMGRRRPAVPEPEPKRQRTMGGLDLGLLLGGRGRGRGRGGFGGQGRGRMMRPRVEFVIDPVGTALSTEEVLKIGKIFRWRQIEDRDEPTSSSIKLQNPNRIYLDVFPLIDPDVADPELQIVDRQQLFQMLSKPKMFLDEEAVQKFEEVLNERKVDEPCKYFRKGACRNGENCRYRHTKPIRACVFYLNKAKCKLGDKCPFTHGVTQKFDKNATAAPQEAAPQSESFKQCAQCSQNLPRCEFSAAEWAQEMQAVCRSCEEGEEPAQEIAAPSQGSSARCSVCGETLPASRFSPSQWAKHTPKCKNCVFTGY